MSKEYVLQKLMELDQVIDNMTDEDLKDFVKDYNFDEIQYHIHSPEFLRVT